MTLDLVVELEPEGYSSSDGEPAYEDEDDFYHGDDDFDGHQYFYDGDEVIGMILMLKYLDVGDLVRN